MYDLLRNLLHLSAVSFLDAAKLAPAKVHSRMLEIKNSTELPRCFSEIKPVFELLTRGVSEGLPDLSHIAVLIHGFDSRPAIWADELARAILAGDRRKLGVIVIDWQGGSR